MLVLGRKVGETIQIGDEITITVVRLGGVDVRLGIEAPKNIPVTRPDMRSKDDRRAA